MTKNRRRFVAVAAAAVLADVASKVVAVRALEARSVNLGVLELRLVRNTGIAFGLGAAFPPWILVLATAGVALVLAILVWRGDLAAGVETGLIVVARWATSLTASSAEAWSTCSISGGGRLYADVCIVAGVGLVFFTGLRRGTCCDDRERLMDDLVVTDARSFSLRCAALRPRSAGRPAAEKENARCRCVDR